MTYKMIIIKTERVTIEFTAPDNNAAQDHAETLYMDAEKASNFGPGCISFDYTLENTNDFEMLVTPDAENDF